MMALSRTERRLRWSGLLISLGLLIQLATLIWSHPLAFVLFLLAGAPLVAAGALLYLLSLTMVSEEGPEP